MTSNPDKQTDVWKLSVKLAKEFPYSVENIYRTIILLNSSGISENAVRNILAQQSATGY